MYIHTFECSPVESTVPIDVNMKLIGSLLKQVADAKGLTVLCSDGQRGASVEVGHIYRYALLQKEVHCDHVSVDAGPVDGTRTIIVIAVLVW